MHCNTKFYYGGKIRIGRACDAWFESYALQRGILLHRENPTYWWFWGIKTPLSEVNALYRVHTSSSVFYSYAGIMFHLFCCIVWDVLTVFFLMSLLCCFSCNSVNFHFMGIIQSVFKVLLTINHPVERYLIIVYIEVIVLTCRVSFEI